MRTPKEIKSTAVYECVLYYPDLVGAIGTRAASKRCGNTIFARGGARGSRDREGIAAKVGGADGHPRDKGAGGSRVALGC